MLFVLYSDWFSAKLCADVCKMGGFACWLNGNAELIEWFIVGIMLLEFRTLEGDVLLVELFVDWLRAQSSADILWEDLHAVWMWILY